MATKSITKNINIKDKKLGKALVFALENASAKKGEEVTYSKSYQEIKRSDIKKMFGE